jgi:pimeloyl-ACP methyl ester carboxylesterase
MQMTAMIYGEQGLNRLRIVLALIAVVGSSTGCAMLDNVLGFEEQILMAAAKGRIGGKIDVQGGATGTLVVVIAIPGAGEEGKPLAVDSYVRSRAGTYAFPVDPGRYVVGAYEDRNKNQLLDPGELVKRLTLGRELVVGPGEVANEDILLTETDVLAELTESVDVFEIVARTPKEQRGFSLWQLSVRGEICDDLNDSSFNQVAGGQGLWRPMDFLNEGKAGIYFLEEYDEDKIPVLFVHGISGYPQQFKTIFDNLDRDQFQPWFYYYPSGFPLESLSNHLAILLERSQIQHGFDKIAIVAHSMGGLVARGAILKYQKETQRRDIRLFVSISTPWGGDVNAAGVSDKPIALPLSFGDMDPASDYIRWVFWEDEDKTTPNRLGSETDYHMIFGFRMKTSRSVADDGTVNLSSLVRPEARDRALSRWPYDLGHSEILHAPDVINRLHSILDERF